jgi:hypothetical protein
MGRFLKRWKGWGNYGNVYRAIARESSRKHDSPVHVKTFIIYIYIYIYNRYTAKLYLFIRYIFR